MFKILDLIAALKNLLYNITVRFSISGRKARAMAAVKLMFL